MSIAIVCMTIDKEENETETVTNDPYDLSAAEHSNQWSNSYMWVYDKRSWHERQENTQNDDVCPGEVGDEEGYEEVCDLFDFSNR